MAGWFPLGVPSAGGGGLEFSPPLDGLTAITAGGLRKLRTTYAGSAIILCKAGDTTGIDIGFTSAGHFDSAAAQTYLGGTTGGLIKQIYDQTGNGHHFVQATTARQPSLVFNASANGKPLIRAFEGSLMTVADNAGYKTNNIHVIGCWKLPPNTPSITTPRRYLIGYPTATNSGNEANRWALTNSGYSWAFLPQLNGDTNENVEGIGAAYRRLLYPYSFSTQSRIFKGKNTTWFDGNGATITYPNAVGLHLFNSPALDGTGSDTGNGSDDGGIDFGEVMLFTSTQASEGTVVSNIVDYYAIAEPSSTFTANGYTFTNRYFGGFGSEPFFSWETLNGVNWYRQGSFDTYSMGRAASGTNASTLMRFEVHRYDDWLASTRSEINTAAFNLDDTMQFSCCVWIEDNANDDNQTWNTIFQHHYTDNGSTTVATAWSMDLSNGVFKVYTDRGGSGGNDTLEYTSGAVTMGQWYDIVTECKVSTSGSADAFKMSINGSEVVNRTGTIFSHNGNGAGYQKLGIYRDPATTGTGAVMYGNIEVTNKATSDIYASRKASPLTHPAP